MEALNLKIVLILTVGFALASILGYLSHRIKLSPILGYLIAGYLIGPYSPGYVADRQIAEQLAEIGIILMMFSVGLQFKWQDLARYKRTAVPGALVQTFFALIVSAALVYSIGWSLEAGIIFGLSIGVASTVVLARILADNALLNTPAGHLSVGWLIVEDIITVAALLILSPLASSYNGEGFSLKSVALAFLFALVKFAALNWVMFTWGKRLVSYLLSKVVLTNSHELFTLTILALTFVVAAGSALLLGTSIALGAFVAGMVMGQTRIRFQISMNALPLKEAFVVVFFLSVGMLFDPYTVVEHPLLSLAVLAIILIVKPLAAFSITLILRNPLKTAFVTALALAQIGEFSFILAERATTLGVLPRAGYDIIIACSLISISINPLLFKLLKTFSFLEKPLH